MYNAAQEITQYLKHNDFSLAVRRTLDVALDTGNPALIYQAIKWSKEYRLLEKTVPPAVPDDFIKWGEAILNEAAVIAADNDRIKSTDLITASKISKTYTKGNFSLKPISLSLKTGEVLGVVGENGNGKTTLLRCLAGQLSLNAGEIKYHLLNQGADHYAVKNHIAFIPQRIPKWHGFLKDNLHFSAALAGITNEENDMMVDFMLERLDLTRYSDLTWNQISSGYRTRFEIARILLQKPRLLILDEPLANLDINAQQTILTDLIFMAKGAHNPMGIVLSSQQLHEVEKVADTVMFIKSGNCVYSSNERDDSATTTAVEFETEFTRDQIMAVFPTDNIELQYNGGFYTIISGNLSADEIIRQLINASVKITYFRDITYSTKRFF